MELLNNFSIEILWQLFFAAALGALIGTEREYKRKGAGLQTYSLVALGSCLFTVVFVTMSSSVDSTGSSTAYESARLIQAIATGIGFIGAGGIFRQASGPIGLTTATGLWVVAAIGVAAGFQLYFLAIIVAILTIAILLGLGRIEEKFFKSRE